MFLWRNMENNTPIIIKYTQSLFLWYTWNMDWLLRVYNWNMDWLLRVYTWNIHLEYGLVIKSVQVPLAWILEVSLVTRKPVFGVSDQVRLKLDCSARDQLGSWNDCPGSKQQRCWSDCTNAQVDLRLCCSHMAKQVFSWWGSSPSVTTLTSFASRVEKAKIRIFQAFSRHKLKLSCLQMFASTKSGVKEDGDSKQVHLHCI